MFTLYSVVTSIHIIVAIIIVALVLMQHGKGADMGAAFGSGASGSLFGSAGSGNVFSRATAICAAIFFVTSLILAYIGTQPQASGSIMQTTVQSQPVAVPAEKTPEVTPESELKQEKAAEETNTSEVSGKSSEFGDNKSKVEPEVISNSTADGTVPSPQGMSSDSLTEGDGSGSKAETVPTD